MGVSEGKHKILLVEDELDTVIGLSELLGEEGFLVLTATNVAEAVKLLTEDKIDLVLTDLRMPGAGGSDLIREAKERFPDLPVFVMTGCPDVDRYVEPQLAGRLELIPKPIDCQTLLTRVRSVLSVQAS